MKNLPVPPSLRDKLGDAGSDALHGMFADAHALATESFERRLAEETGKLRLDIANLKFELLKWLFLFWVGQLAGTTALCTILR